MSSLSIYDLENICAIPGAFHGYRPVGCDTWFQIRDPVRYAELRPHLKIKELADFLVTRPEFVDYWLRYSADDRSAGGLYFVETGGSFVVGRRDPPREEVFSDRAVAAANYITKALDAVNSPQVDDSNSEFNSG